MPSNAYGAGFVKIYDETYLWMAKVLLPAVLESYRALPIAKTNSEAVDVCCGTGFVARTLAAEGLSVTGIDRSAPMIEEAERTSVELVGAGKVRFVCADVVTAPFPHGVGLVVSTGALLHMPDVSALERVLANAAAALVPGGLLAFDLWTRVGLAAGWTSSEVRDLGYWIYESRGVFVEEQKRAFLAIRGFVKAPDGRYDRVDESLTASAFSMREVTEILGRLGFEDVTLRDGMGPGAPVPDPEAVQRVLFTARKA